MLTKVYCYRYDGKAGFIPRKVQDWISLRTPDGDFPDGCLTELNDNKRCTFAQIADVIESNPEGLFL